MTVTPVMSYDQVAGIKPCVQQLCLDTCNYEEMQAIWDTAVCTGADGGARRRRACAARQLRMSLRRGQRQAGQWRASTARASPDSCCWRPRRRPADGAGKTPRGAPPRDLAFRRSFASTVEDPQCRFPPFFVHGVSVQGWAHSSAVRAGGS